MKADIRKYFLFFVISLKQFTRLWNDNLFEFYYEFYTIINLIQICIFVDIVFHELIKITPKNHILKLENNFFTEPSLQHKKLLSNKAML